MFGNTKRLPANAVLVPSLHHPKLFVTLIPIIAVFVYFLILYTAHFIAWICKRLYVEPRSYYLSMNL